MSLLSLSKFDLNDVFLGTDIEMECDMEDLEASTCFKEWMKLVTLLILAAFILGFTVVSNAHSFIDTL